MDKTVESCDETTEINQIGWDQCPSERGVGSPIYHKAFDEGKHRDANVNHLPDDDP